MGFRFTVTKTWQDERLGVFHLIGRLEEGAIVPNSHAIVEHHPELGAKASRIAAERRNQNSHTLRDALRHRDGRAGIF